MTYDQAVRELEALGIMPERMPSLAPIKNALARTGLSSKIDPKKNIIVAGTNGKGSTSATLSRLLLSAEQRVGLYTSPHLVSTRERFRINDEDVSEDDFTRAYLYLKPSILSEKLSHFEALTLIAAYLFNSGATGPSVDWTIWEVGMGGLFDATNAIPHHYCAITRLGLDHQAFLGSNLTEIATQKFGVIGKNSVAVYSPMDPELAPLRAEVEMKTGCQWISSKPVELIDLDQLHTPWGNARMTLIGPRAAENSATALTLFEAMGFNPSHHLQALEKVRWPGRFSRIENHSLPCPLYVSGDHNVQGVESLIPILSRISRNQLHLVVGIGKDKDAEKMLELLCALPKTSLYLTETPFKPLPLEEYPLRFKNQALLRNRYLSTILGDIALRAQPQDLVLITGSLYLVGEAVSLSRQSSSSFADTKS
jgi:dihydrofolate synthase/folylpolyglutamate synthase